jgi:hypothetical protein
MLSAASAAASPSYFNSKSQPGLPKASARRLSTSGITVGSAFVTLSAHVVTATMIRF